MAKRKPKEPEIRIVVRGEGAIEYCGPEIQALAKKLGEFRPLPEGKE